MLPSAHKRRVVHKAKIAEGHYGKPLRVCAGLRDKRPAGPVQIDFPEPTSLRHQRRERGRRFVKNISLLIRSSGFVKNANRTELIGLGSLDYGMPAERVDRVWVRRHAKYLRAFVVGRHREL